ncbi:MAG: ATP/GTP-binding protein, partial [Anaerolineales bacterium]|nr:ATP/GTP-binding protein [Anaerolineales bacterium]
MSLAKRIISGDRRALARALTLVENGAATCEGILAEMHAYGGNAHMVGVTGSPGVGKSTMVNVLAQLLRARGDTVGVLAVDPTSPFSSG